MEKSVSYIAENSYSVLNKRNKKTENNWMVFHGLGYLSRYFIKYFETLDPQKNYLVAPQAPSKYYQKNFKYVGACWLTKEMTEVETGNVVNYIHQVYLKELEGRKGSLILMGYSQGVSVMLRWMAKKKIRPAKVIIHSGGIPKELTSRHFSFLKKNLPVHLIYGERDEYFDPSRIKTEVELARQIFSDRLEVLPFSGKHEVATELLKKLSEE